MKRRPFGKKGVELSLVGLGGIAVADLWSKAAAFAALGPGDYHWLAGQWLAFTAVENPGIMWGAFPQWSVALPWLRIGAGLIVLFMIRSTARAQRGLHLALGCVLGGAIGNVYDGFAFGHVRDFVYVDLDLPGFDPFPVFNVADAGISVGVAVLALSMIFERKPPR